MRDRLPGPDESRGTGVGRRARQGDQLGDVKAMARRIIELAEKPSLWSTMGRAGRAHVEEICLLDRPVASTLEILAGSVRR
jgi:hypothetical protein